MSGPADWCSWLSICLRDRVWLGPRWKARCLCLKSPHCLSSCFHCHWRLFVANVLGDRGMSKGSILSHSRRAISCATLQRQSLTIRRWSFHCSSAQETTCRSLGESRSQAMRRFLSLERSLYAKEQFDEFDSVMNEYFEKGHAELVPLDDLEKSLQDVFYLPMYAVKRESSTTTKIRAVFDASAKSSTGVSLMIYCWLDLLFTHLSLMYYFVFVYTVWLLLLMSVTCTMPLNSLNPIEIYIDLFGRGIPRIFYLTTA